MGSIRIRLLVAGALLAFVPALAHAQDGSADEKAKAEAAEKAKLQAVAPKVMIVPPSSGSGTVTGPLTHATPTLLPIAPLKVAPTAKLPGTAPSSPAAAAAPATLTLPYRKTTAELGAVGTAAAVAAAAVVTPFTPVRLTTAALSAAGSGAPVPAPAAFTPVRVTTAPLSAAGRPSGG